MKLTARLLCILLCGLLVLSACTKDNSKNTTEDESLASMENSNITSEVSEITDVSNETSNEEMEFVPVIRFAVASDTHVSSAGSTEALRLKKLFESAYAYSQSDPYYKTLDAFVIVGDMTNNGNANEYAALKQVIEANIKDETTLITVMGNHEFYGGGKTVYKEYMDQNLDKDVNIKGFHFICISPTDGENYSSSKSFLENALQSAAAEDGDKPIFTFQHHHLKDTVYVSAEWYTSSSDMLKSIYKKYPQVVNFSGHSHGPVNNPTSIWQGDFTCLGTGTLSYFEMTTGMTYGTIPPDASNAAQYYIIEVDENNLVRIMPYNLLTGDFFKTPSNTDDDDNYLVYYIDIPSGERNYRISDRLKAADIPAFDGDAEISVSQITENTAFISFPQAKDNDCVYSYEIVCASEKGNITFKYFSEYYFEPMPQTLSFRLSGFKPKTEYMVSIYPVDCYGKKGSAITASFTTLEGEDIIYNSKNPVTFTGTFTDFDSLDEIKFSTSTFAYGGKINGDIFVGDWASGSLNSNSKAALEKGKGYNGSAALAVWSTDSQNQGLYIFATDDNKNTTLFPDVVYLRVWVDFTGIDFRKANFGLVSPYGGLFTTDETDGRSDLSFWYMAEESDKWVEYTHGSDGCFGDAQGSSVRNFKGWLAFPVKDFTYRSGTGTVSEGSGVSYHYNQIAGIYMFWDYSDNGSYTGNKFYLDEIHLAGDYTVFENYNNN